MQIDECGCADCDLCVVFLFLFFSCLEWMVCADGE